MDIDATLDVIHMGALLRKAYAGDAKAQDEYNALIREARENENAFRLLWLFYMRERTLREILEE